MTTFRATDGAYTVMFTAHVPADILLGDILTAAHTVAVMADEFDAAIHNADLE